MSANKPSGNPLPQRKSFAQVAAAANVSAKQQEIPSSSKSQQTNAQASTQKQASETSPVPVTNGSTSRVGPADAAAAIAPTSVPPVVFGSMPASQSSDVDQLRRLMDKTGIINDTKDSCASKVAPSDTKSITSRTTLTLDEKESLRPDDSASMQAAVDDSSLSPNGSAVGAQQSSDPDVRAFQDQLHQIDRTGAQNLATQREAEAGKPASSESQNTGIDPAIFPSNLNQSTFATPQPSTSTRSKVPLNYLNNPPDEKLLEALASPKDRLFVLKVEQDMIDFIKDSKEECLQLPATNSFYRLLSHKLADYYLLGHVVDESMMSVRIFRTANATLPPPLIGTDTTTDGSEPAPSAPKRQIMRRNVGPDGKTFVDYANSSDKNFDSLTSSKAPSDAGGNPATPGASEEAKDGNSGDKSALTREERENRYNEARARIFKDFQVPEIAESNSDGADKGISRSSSASGLRKAKKKSKPNDDGFEARSAFDQYGQRITAQGPMDLEQFAGTYNAPANFLGIGQFHPNAPSFQPGRESMYSGYNFPENFNPMPMQFWNGQVMPPSYMSPQHGPGNMESSGYAGYGPMNGFDQNQYPPGNLASQATPKGNPPALANYHQGYMPPHENSSWSQGNFGTQYGSGYSHGNANPQFSQPYVQSRMAQPPQQQPGLPGPYQSFSGQQAQFYGQGSPFPNYSNPHFNPHSQNFVPNPRPVYPPISPDQAMSYSNPGQTFYPGSPTMQRQMSNTSPASGFNGNNYHSGNMAGMRPNGRGQSPFRHVPPHSRTQNPSQGGNNSNSISKWTTPANLPAKPPPPAVVSPYVEVPRDPENLQPLPPKPFSAITSPSSLNTNNNGYLQNGVR